MSYAYFKRKYPGPGTGNYAFDAQMTLPLFQVQGAGTLVKGQLNVTQSGNLTALPVAYKRSVANGGYIAGQIIGQPLSPPAGS